MQGNIIGLGTPLLQHVRLPVIEHARLQGSRQTFALHQRKGLLQVQFDTLTVVRAVDELCP
ncbi:hypothetical protein D3C77_805200 [compost metagenome]